MKCKKIVAMCMTVLMLGSFAAAAHAEAEEPLPLVEEMLEELEETEEATEPEQPEKDTLPRKPHLRNPLPIRIRRNLRRMAKKTQAQIRRKNTKKPDWPGWKPESKRSRLRRP